MKTIILAVIVTILGISLIPSAYARAVVSIGIGGGCCGYYPYYSHNYYGYPSYYGYPTYYTPPPSTVIYAVPPVTYVQPQVVTTAIPTISSFPNTISATQGDSPFVDSRGRTCREFQSSFNGAPVSGTACLQSDGTWRTVDQQ